MISTLLVLCAVTATGETGTSTIHGYFSALVLAPEDNPWSGVA
jgi:hypothetical protein